jgi:tRNA (guanine-N1)-methyltransferase
MDFHVLTLFPDMVDGVFEIGLLGRAQRRGLLNLHTVNIREFTLDKHGKVDDYPYGGGAGMLMQAQPVFDAWKSIGVGKRTIYLSPQGTPFTQKMAQELAKEEELVFLCGHYEGIDQRVLDEIVTDYVSIGDYILTGGELPAMVMMDAIARFVPGVLHNQLSALGESFHNDLLEYPQYSRPETWHDKTVPGVLLSGSLRSIRNWQLEQAKEKTAQARPDLYEKYMKKESAVKRLKNRKRDSIHLIEALERGEGELIYESKNHILLYLPDSKMCLLGCTAKRGDSMMETAQSDDDGWLTAIPRQAKGIWIPQSISETEVQETEEKIESEDRNRRMNVYRQIKKIFPGVSYQDYVVASYTIREQIPQHTSKTAVQIHQRTAVETETKMQQCATSETEIQMQQSIASVTGIRSIFEYQVGNQIAAVSAICKDGSITLPYVTVQDGYTEIAAELTAYIVNSYCQEGRTAFFYASNNDTQGLDMLSRMKLNISTQTFTLFTRNNMEESEGLAHAT